MDEAEGGGGRGWRGVRGLQGDERDSVVYEEGYGGQRRSLLSTMLSTSRATTPPTNQILISTKKATRGWNQRGGGGWGDSREHSSELSDQSSGGPESTRLVEKGGYLGRGTTVSSGETE